MYYKRPLYCGGQGSRKGHYAVIGNNRVWRLTGGSACRRFVRECEKTIVSAVDLAPSPFGQWIRQSGIKRLRASPEDSIRHRMG